MNRVALTVSLVLAPLLFIVAHTWADIESGKAAYLRGDYERAFREIKQLAEQGDPFAQGLLGGLYEWGKGVKRDCVEAVKWYQKSAEAGEVIAQYRLGVLYGSSNWWCDGLQRNDAEAVKWLREAAVRGDINAKSTLADHYKWGRGVPIDSAEAFKLYREAAEQGSASDMRHVGDMYEEGKGVPQHYGEALKWYHKSVEHGDEGAMVSIGKLYEEGKGVPVDYVQAHMWYNLAAAKKHAYSLERDRIAKKMTSAQIAKAQEMARSWKPKK